MRYQYSVVHGWSLSTAHHFAGGSSPRIPSADDLHPGEDAAAGEFRGLSGGGAVCIIETRTACNGGGGERRRRGESAAVRRRRRLIVRMYVPS